MDYPLVNAAIFIAEGILLFWIAFAIMRRALPYSLWKEIIENRNSAAAIVVGAISLGMCIIIAAAVH